MTEVSYSITVIMMLESSAITANVYNFEHILVDSLMLVNVM